MWLSSWPVNRWWSPNQVYYMSYIRDRFLASRLNRPRVEAEETKQPHSQTQNQSTRPTSATPTRSGQHRREYGSQTTGGCDRALRLPHQPLPSSQHIVDRDSLADALRQPCCQEECLLYKITVPQLRELRAQWVGFSSKDEQTRWLVTLLRAWFNGSVVYHLPVGTVPVVCRTAFLLALGTTQGAFSDRRLTKALAQAGIDRNKEELGPAVAGVIPDDMTTRHAPKAAMALSWWKVYVSNLQRIAYDAHGQPMWHTFENLDWKQLHDVHSRSVPLHCNPDLFEIVALTMPS
jgi:hypothetical protein